MMAIRVYCPYCRAEAPLVDGTVVYPHRPDLASLRFYRCTPCDAHVGCHKGTTTPLGRLANAELRKAKQRAHAAFDPLWKGGKRKLSRSAAYSWLAKAMQMMPADCHIGMMDVGQCQRVVEVCRARSDA